MRRSDEQVARADKWVSRGIESSQRIVRIEQSFDKIQLRVPKAVKLLECGAGIQWIEGKREDKGAELKDYAPSCLQAFLTLTEPSPEKVLEFARTWGPLVPAEEPEIEGEITITARGTTRQKHFGSPRLRSFHTSPLTDWSQKAVQMAAMIDLVAYLWDEGVRDEREAKRAWDALVVTQPGGKSSFPSLDSAMPLSDAVEYRDVAIKILVGQIATSWLQEIGAEPLVAWGEPAFAIRLYMPKKRYTSLHSALVIHFLTVISNPVRLYRCGWCGRRSFKGDDERMTRSGLLPCCTDPACRSRANSSKANKHNKKSRDNKKRALTSAASAETSAF